MKKIILLTGIVLIAVFGYRFYLASQDHYEPEVHVHSDIALYVNDQKVDLAVEQYQSSVGNIKSEDIHLHDRNGKVVHRHAKGITFVEFINSLGYTLTNDCLTTDIGQQYCNTATTSVALYVNDTRIEDIASYITQEEDKILLTVGEKDKNLKEQLASVTDEACIPSGTCPERGVPVVETCGLTCDVTFTPPPTLKQKLLFVFTGHY